MEYSLFLLLLCSLGIIFGFISSTPLGPINLLVAENYFSSKKIKIIPFLIGVILTDAIFAYLALLGLEKAHKYIQSNGFTFIEDYNLPYYINLTGAIVIILIGIIIGFKIFSKEKESKPSSKLSQSLSKSNTLAFIKGSFLCGSNPGFIAYWLSISGTLKEISFTLFPDFQLTTINRSLIAFGIILGDIIWFGLFIFLLKKGTKKFSSKILFYVRFVISIVLITMGMIFLINVV